MEANRTVSNKTRTNWILDAGLFLGAIIASISGIYFLIFPDGGYMGGRNPYYGIKVIFDRSGWEWIHTWLSLGMVAIALIHIVLHWKWIVSTSKRVARDTFTSKKSNMNAKGLQNVLVDGLVALSFLICAISGVYFIFAGENRGGLAVGSMFLFSRTIWEIIHTWSSVVFISGGIVHFAIHWGWVTKVTRKMFRRVPGKSNPTVFEKVVFEN